MKNAIKTLLAKGISHRQAASLLMIDRKTIDRYAGLLKAQNGLQAPAGYIEQNGPEVPAESESENGPQVPTGFSCQKSACHQYQKLILEKLDKGLSAKRIYQDLKAETAFNGGYDAVKRYVRKQLNSHPQPYRRMECASGAEAQIDFGLGAYIEENGRKKRPWLFRIVLGHSRKAYSECVWHQNSKGTARPHRLKEF